MSINQKIVNDFIKNKIEFVTTVPCKQLAGVIDEIEASKEIFHIPSNKEDEGMGALRWCLYGRQALGDHYAEYSDWRHHQHAGDFDPILQYSAADADQLSR